MKKQVKIVTTILMVIMVLTTLAEVVFASEASLISEIAQGGQTPTTGGIVNFGRQVVSVVRVIGIVIAVIILLILGIKYMIGSAEERAEYKKTMVPYIVGAVLIFASTTLVQIVYELADSLNGNGGGTSGGAIPA